MEKQLELEKRLGSFDRGERRNSLAELHRMLMRGEVAAVPEIPVANLHCHTFFSFNAYGYSPSSIAWEAKKRGLFAAGIIDFDVLDGVDEFLEASSLLGLRCVAGIESRVFIPEWKDVQINSPGEPGICYFMGTGFIVGDPKMRESEPSLRRMHDLAQERNRAVLGRVNEYLGDLKVDWERDVLSLTPSGNPTERHMVEALDRKSCDIFPDPVKRAAFWSEALGKKKEEVLTLFRTPIDFRLFIRARLMKSGGPGYTAPDGSGFPPLQEMVSMTRALGAVPTQGWLDGTRDGEKDPDILVDFMTAAGSDCLSIVPDRNWNIRDEEERRTKVCNLYRIVEAADKRNIPVIAGTEMNKHGQPFVDDFFSEALKPVADVFMRGARIVCGHTLLRRAVGIGLSSPEVEERFRGDLKKRNLFFRELGELVPSHETDGIVKTMWEKSL